MGSGAGVSVWPARWSLGQAVLPAVAPVYTYIYIYNIIYIWYASPSWCLGFA